MTGTTVRTPFFHTLSVNCEGGASWAAEQLVRGGRAGACCGHLNPSKSAFVQLKRAEQPALQNSNSRDHSPPPIKPPTVTEISGASLLVFPPRNVRLIFRPFPEPTFEDTGATRDGRCQTPARPPRRVSGQCSESLVRKSFSLPPNLAQPPSPSRCVNPPTSPAHETPR